MVRKLFILTIFAGMLIVALYADIQKPGHVFPKALGVVTTIIAPYGSTADTIQRPFGSVAEPGIQKPGH